LVSRSRYELSGKAVLVTGAARGIGAETARQLARKGARLSLVGLEPELLEQVAGECGPDAVWFEADVTDPEALERAVEGTADRLGGIDVAMANAGIAVAGTVRQSELAPIERLLEINLIGAIRTLKLCLPHVIDRQGYLLPVASMAAVGHVPGVGAYSASKAGLEAFANSVRPEVKHLGVDVGVAYYSWIDTEMVRGADGHRDFSYLRDGLKWPLARTYPVAKAAAATVRGIERRARWVTCPGWIKPLILVRGVVPFVIEAEAADRMAEFERLSREEAERLGDRATGPVGAGGEAALRSSPLS
jgi:NAD(P)-dependent dehydrogenase (short-subunit alcohol dehydrogenase family)